MRRFTSLSLRILTTAAGLVFGASPALVPAACGQSSRPDEQVPTAVTAPPGLRFVDVTREAGLDRVILAGRPDKDHLLDSAGTGAAWIDYDRDGFVDLYIVNSWKMSGSEVVEKGKNALYRNRGDGTFEDVTDKAGVGGEGHWGAGVAVADYDADGWPDLLVTNFGPNVLYRNRGDGTFENVAPQAGIEIPGWNTGAAFLDADGDRDLDLYIAGYITCSMDDVLKTRPNLDWKGVDKVAEGPFGLEGAPDHFFLSDGKGHFREATEEAGLVDKTLGFGFTVQASDLDQDGDLDLYVANDSDPNYMYRNEGNGTFTEVGLWAGTALDANGAAQAGMGVAIGDANGDGFPDIVVDNFSEDFTVLYRGLGDGFFEDATEDAGLGNPTFRSLSWGAVLADLDNDGDLDLVIANGHIYPQVDRHPELGFSYAQKNQVFSNDGKAHFKEVTAEAGPGFSLVQCNRAALAADYDNDGDLDLVFTNLDETPTLLRNDSPARGHWLSVTCAVPPHSVPLVGTEVQLTIGSTTLRREISSSSSYVSAPDQRLHFGLGPATSVDRIEVRWTDGSKTTLENIAADQFLTIKKQP
ncbi:MAG: CRTAC1 family protein [Acidobacteriota bacterium]